MNAQRIAHREYENGKIYTTYCDGVTTVTYRDGTVKLLQRGVV